MIDQGRHTFAVRFLRGMFLLLMRILFRIEHHGRENIPPNGPLIITPNHVTYFDPFWVAVRVYRTLRFMTWDKPLRAPILGNALRWLGAFPVSLENPERSAYRQSLRILEQGQALMIFPEGGRSPDGRLMPFKEGAARLALKTGATILPVRVEGGDRVWSSQMFLPLPRKVKVFYLDPIACPKLKSAEREHFDAEVVHLIERIRISIASKHRGGIKV